MNKRRKVEYAKIYAMCHAKDTPLPEATLKGTTKYNIWELKKEVPTKKRSKKKKQ